MFAYIKSNSKILVYSSLVSLVIISFFQNCSPATSDLGKESAATSQTFETRSAASLTLLNQLAHQTENIKEAKVDSPITKAIESSKDNFDSLLLEPTIIYLYKYNNKVIKLTVSPGFTELRLDPNSSIQLEYTRWVSQGYVNCKFSSKWNLTKTPCQGFNRKYTTSRSSEYPVSTMPEGEYYFEFADATMNSKKQFTIRIVKRTAGRIFQNTLEKTIDPHCFYDPQYDACLFWKNPVASRGQRYLEHLDQNCSNCKPGIDPLNTNLKILDQLYPVKLDARRKKTLVSSSFFIERSIVDFAGRMANINFSNLKVVFGFSPENNMTFSAAMGFYWLEQLENEFVKNRLPYYAGTKKIPVNIYDIETVNNAYFTPLDMATNKEAIKIGIAKADGGETWELPVAVNSEVFIHEMGHANHWFSVLKEMAKGNRNLAMDFMYDHSNNYQASFYIDFEEGQNSMRLLQITSGSNSNSSDAISLTTLKTMINNDLIFLGFSDDAKLLQVEGDNGMPLILDGVFLKEAMFLQAKRVDPEFIKKLKQYQTGKQPQDISFRDSADFLVKYLPTYSNIELYARTYVMATSNCKDSGCVGGFAEGIADVQNWLVFKNSPTLFETWCNQVEPTCYGTDLRNVLNSRRPLSDYIGRHGPGLEYHDAGGLYSALLWRIANGFKIINTKNGWDDFRSVFTEHLGDMAGNLTFIKVKLILKSAVQARGFSPSIEAKYLAIIDREFLAQIPNINKNLGTR